MPHPRRLPALVGSAALLMALPSPVLAECGASADGDRRFITEQLAWLRRAAPALPRGWRVFRTRATPLGRQSACGGGGDPYGRPVEVEYTVIALPVGAPRLRIRTASPAEAGALRRRPQPAPLEIAIQVNAPEIDRCADAQDDPVPGARFAFHFDSRPPCAVGPFAGAGVRAAAVRAWGDWVAADDDHLARFEKARESEPVPFYRVYTLDVVVKGADAAAVRAVTARLDSSRTFARLPFARAPGGP